MMKIGIPATGKLIYHIRYICTTADVHTNEIRSKNNLSRFSGWPPSKERTQSPKCCCEGFYMRIATGTGYTIKDHILISYSPGVHLF